MGKNTSIGTIPAKCVIKMLQNKTRDDSNELLCPPISWCGCCTEVMSSWMRSSTPLHHVSDIHLTLNYILTTWGKHAPVIDSQPDLLYCFPLYISMMWGYTLNCTVSCNTVHTYVVDIGQHGYLLKYQSHRVLRCSLYLLHLIGGFLIFSFLVWLWFAHILHKLFRHFLW